MSEASPKRRETHPDRGDRTAEYSMVTKAGLALGQWYETGVDHRHQHGVGPAPCVHHGRHGTQVNGKAVDFVVAYQTDEKAPNMPYPTDVVDKFAMGPTWAYWRDGKTQLNKQPNNSQWNEVYRIYEATSNGDGTWGHSAALLGVMAASAKGRGLCYWIPGDPTQSGPSMDTSKVGIGPKNTTNLYFEAQATTLVEDSPSVAWYISGDDSD